ncbi:nitroreductase family deazaflavin-dependent oxidoreductase [Nocardioides sp.]|uniref:nitroreductase family deazaflavin-dependent oxidoreductase n=1 Tax=Nocardioides sp. TaxID=35761 RepID=UPI002B268D5E|nr:nitroreductase family deazaflavin-dependent oxidoreductase [Nocardioides sp.]
MPEKPGDLSAAEIEKRKKALASPATAKIIKYGAKAQVKVFRLTNGRIGSKWRIGAGWKNPVPTLLLDHVGRKSGTVFTTPLLYLEDGADLIVVGSQGGLPKNPQWVANLQATPDTTVHLRGGRRDVRARVAEPDERERLWPLLVDLYADFATYQTTTDRVIPVVILAPR